MKTKLKKMGCILLVSLTFFACKKEEKQADFQENARQWYLKNMDKATYTLKSTKNEVLQVKREVNWDEAKAFTQENGILVLSVPVAVKSASGEINGSYLMLISQIRGNYQVQMTYNVKKDYFKVQPSATEISQLYNRLNSHSSQEKTATTNINGKLMSDEGDGGMHDEPTCTDWYWVEPTYDGNGNIIGEVWVYLYRNCSSSGDGGGGSGGSTEDEEATEARKLITAQSTSQAISIALVEETATTRKKQYDWKFLENSFGMWHYSSTEEGTHIKVGSNWKWNTLTHKSIGRSGVTLGASITVEITSSEPTVGISNAGMTLNYNYSSSMLFKGFPIAIDFRGKTNSPVWDVNY